ncbi:helix-turn-helix domain-containing protein [Paraburkholderia sabiae]|uniref:Helix-turn-helix domain-containing protein n=1 Tax=Paraburkholderia sabiae TaxID=273251 RepID=A0ABU9QKD2_9BURK|nr:helix-turn-helix domain-containing protein [Paraburkholderia sabiae]WJZ76496.1 helix-turn-helix domain-containing protein [Paraburkholderia sabiae]CAD6560242.1 Transcriptional activator NphR [Paraburkholderia sabiae]
MTTSFSTSEIAPQERLEFWRDVVCRTYVSVTCDPLECELDGQVTLYPFGFTQLTDISSSAASYKRTVEIIRQSPSEDLQFCLILDGSLSIEQAGQQAVLGAGDIGLYDAAQPFSLHLGERYRALNLKVPRPVLLARVADVDKLMARRFPGESKLGALVNSLLRESVRVGDFADEQLAARLCGSVVDILSAAIENELLGCRENNSRQGAQLDRIKCYMLERLGDTDLDIATIASECHMAPRTVHRLFAMEGTTAIRWLWQRRLAASYRALAEGHVRQVSEAAINFGFSDFSHFTRAFKKAFGIVPHSLLCKTH